MQRSNSRTSFVSRKKAPRASFVRFIVKDAKLQLSPSGEGRGYYVLKDEIPAALQKKAFDRLVHRSLLTEEEELIKNAYGK